MEGTKRIRHSPWAAPFGLVAVLAGAAVTACSLVCQPAVAADATSLAAFGQLPSLEDVAISPDGTKLALVTTSGESRKLLVIPLSKKEVIGAVLVGTAKLRDVEWVDDDNIVATVSSTSPPPFGFIGATREWYQLVNFAVSKLRVHPLSFDVGNVQTFNVISDGWTIRDVSGHAMLYTRGYCVREETVPCLFSFAYPERRALDR